MNNDRTITITIENGKVDVQTSGGNELSTPGCAQNLGRINHQDYSSQGYYNNLDTPTSEELNDLYKSTSEEQNNLDESTFEKDHQDDTNVLGTDQLRTGFIRNQNEVIFKTDGSQHQIGESYYRAGYKTQYTRYYMTYKELNGKTLESFKKGPVFRHDYEYYLHDANLSYTTINNLTLVGMQWKLLGEHKKIPFTVERTSFNDSLLTDCVFSLANLTAASFERTTLSKQQFLECNLHDAKFINTKMQYTSIKSCSMFATNFSYADLSGTIFDNVIMEQVIFTNANLSMVKFLNCVFSDSPNFTDSSLKGVSFENVLNFELANFTRAKYDQHTTGITTQTVVKYKMIFERS